MRCARSLTSILASGALGLAACGDNTTEPSSVAQPNPAAPELAITRDSWITRASPPVPRVNLFTATVPNPAGQSVVYAIGGNFGDNTSTKRVDAYNVATNSWRRRADMPTPLRDQTGSVLNGKIYVAGGSTGRYVQTPFLYVYNPVTNTWTRKRDMPAPGTGGASGVIQGKLYVLTRYSNNIYSYALYRYNPSTDSWVTLPGPPASEYKAGAILYDKFYAVGKSLVVYDPATNQWTTKTPPPLSGLEQGDAVGLGGKMYVIGLQLYPEIPPFPKRRYVTYVYNPFSDTWSERTPAELAVFTATKVYVNGKPRIEAIYSGFNLQYNP
jgi:N-acetylneuraminic acid mutarotase